MCEHLKEETSSNDQVIQGTKVGREGIVLVRFSRGLSFSIQMVFPTFAFRARRVNLDILN